MYQCTFIAETVSILYTVQFESMMSLNLLIVSFWVCLPEKIRVKDCWSHSDEHSKLENRRILHLANSLHRISGLQFYLVKQKGYVLPARNTRSHFEPHLVDRTGDDKLHAKIIQHADLKVIIGNFRKESGTFFKVWDCWTGISSRPTETGTVYA